MSSTQSIDRVLLGLQKVARRVEKSVSALDELVIQSLPNLPKEQRLDVYSEVTRAYQQRVAQVPTIRHHLANTRRKLVKNGK
jgi:hypothetical protein